MAGVAEAMAASSILLETGSVASNSVDHRRRRKQEKDDDDDNKGGTSRECLCRLGSACQRMSAAFAVAQDPRGDFVVLPSNIDNGMRKAFYRYLRPEYHHASDIKECIVVPTQELIDQMVKEAAEAKDDGKDYRSINSYSVDESESDNHSGGGGGSRSGRSRGSRESNRGSNADEKSYDSRGSFDTVSQRSSDSRGSYSSRNSEDSLLGRRNVKDDGDGSRSYDSRKSYDSRGSYSSRGSQSSRGSYDDASLRSDRDEGDNNKHVDMDEGMKHKDQDFDDTNEEEKKQDNEDENEGDFEIRTPGKNNNDDERSVVSELSHDDEGIEEYVAAHHFHPKIIKKHFDICRERRPEDDLIPLFTTTMTEKERRDCKIPVSQDRYDLVSNSKSEENIAQDEFWVVPSYSLDKAHDDWRKLMRSRLRSKDLSSSSDSSSGGSKWKVAYALAHKLMAEEAETKSGEMSGHSPLPERVESNYATEESPSASDDLTNKIIKAPSIDQTWNDKCTLKKDKPAPNDDPNNPRQAESKEDDESGSQPSSCSKSDHTPTPSDPPSPTTPPPKQQGAPEKRAFEHAKATVSKPSATVASPVNSESSPFCLIAYCLFLGFMATTVLHCVKVLVSKEGAMACSTDACNYYTKQRSFSRVAMHYSLAMTPEVPYYVDSLSAIAKSSQTFVTEVVADLTPVKAVESWARRTHDCIHSTPPEVQMLLLSSVLLEAQNQVMKSLVKLPPVAAIDRWATSTFHYIHSTPPEVQLIALDAKLKSIQNSLEEAYESSKKRVALMKTQAQLFLITMRYIIEELIEHDRTQAALGLLTEKAEFLWEIVREVTAQEQVQAGLQLMKTKAQLMSDMAETLMASDTAQVTLEKVKEKAEMMNVFKEEVMHHLIQKKAGN